MTLTGWTFEEIDNSPASRLDWLLETNEVVEKFRADKAEEARKRV